MSPAALRPRPLVLVVVAGVRPIHPLLHHLGGHLVRLLMVKWSTLVNIGQPVVNIGQQWSTFGQYKSILGQHWVNGMSV